MTGGDVLFDPAVGHASEDDLFVHAGRRQNLSAGPGQRGDRALVFLEDMRRAVAAADAKDHFLAPIMDGRAFASGGQNPSGLAVGKSAAGSVETSQDLFKPSLVGLNRR